MLTFPQYRRLENRSYYKIVSETELYEIQRVGHRFSAFHLIAYTFLDRNLIQDLLSGDGGRYETIVEEEYEAVKMQSK